MMKTKEENSMIDRIGVVYAEYDTKLSWSIGLGVNYDENKIRKLRDWLYRCGLYEK